MKYLKTNEQFENQLLLENADPAVLEPPSLLGYKSIQTKILKDIKLDLYFVTTFGTAIPLFYPVIEKLLNNADFSMPFSKNNVALMTMFALAVLFKESKTEIDKLKTVISEKGLLNISNWVLDAIKSIKAIFSDISAKFGKVVRNMTELFSYTALLVPFINCLLEYANTNEISIKTLTTMAVGVIVSGITKSLMYVSDMLYDKLKAKLKSNKTTVYDTETESGIILYISKIFDRIKKFIEKNQDYEMIDKTRDSIYYKDLVINRYKSFPLQKDFNYSITVKGEYFDSLRMPGITDVTSKFYQYMSAKAKLADTIGQGHRQRD